MAGDRAKMPLAQSCVRTRADGADYFVSLLCDSTITKMAKSINKTVQKSYKFTHRDGGDCIRISY